MIWLILNLTFYSQTLLHTLGHSSLSKCYISYWCSKTSKYFSWVLLLSHASAFLEPKCQALHLLLSNFTQFHWTHMLCSWTLPSLPLFPSASYWTATDSFAWPTDLFAWHWCPHPTLIPFYPSKIVEYAPLY